MVIIAQVTSKKSPQGTDCYMFSSRSWLTIINYITHTYELLLA